MRAKIILAILGFLLVITPTDAIAQPPKQVIFLLADYLDLSDLDARKSPFLYELSYSAASGLLNTNTASSRVYPHTHGTISAGRPAQGGKNGVLAYQVQEPLAGEQAGHLFKRYTGQLLSENEIAILNWPQIIGSNQGKYNSRPGTLGSLLKDAGLSIAVLGNSDTPDTLHRPGALIASDLAGIISNGEIGEHMLRPSQGLLSWRTDYKQLLAEAKRIVPTTDFLVIDFGDLNRLEAIAPLALKDIVKQERGLILEDMDKFCQSLFEEIDLDHTLVILASATPSSIQIQNKNYLVPIMMFNNNLQTGVLTSNTTRRSGLIANTDLAATILNFFDLAPASQITGQPAFGVNLWEEEGLSYLKSINERMVFIYQIRPWIVKPYVTLQIISIALSIPLFFTLRRLIPYYRYWLAFLVAFPVTLLIMGTFTHLGVLAYIIIAIVLAFVIVSLAFRYTSDSALDPFILISAITAALVLIDLITGSLLMQQSVLGYDPIIGARYYGIGNEYMGVLIGSSFLSIGVILQRRKKQIYVLFAVLYFGVLILLMMSAGYGANLGGTIAAFFSFVYWFWRWQKEFLRKYLVFILPVVVFLVAIMVLGGVSFNSGSPSHIGRTYHLIRQEGIIELVDIVVRKGQMNLKLIRYTSWSKVFLLALLAMVILAFKPSGFVKNLSYNQPAVYEALLAILVGSFTALIWNDSGIVAAATAMIYSVYPLLSIALKEVNAKIKI